MTARKQQEGRLPGERHPGIIERSFWTLPLALVCFVAISFVTLTLPDHPDAFSTDWFLRLPIEIPLIGFALLRLSRRPGTILAMAATMIIGILLFLKIADIGVQSAFQRRFNPYLDVKMLADGWSVLSGSVGIIAAALAITAIAAAFLGLLALFCWSQLRLAAAGAAARRALTRVFGGVLVAGLALWPLGPFIGMKDLADAQAAPYLGARLVLIANSVADMRYFEQELAAEKTAPSGNELFPAVHGRDVVLIFVESYGRSAIEDPRYISLIGPRLDQIERRLAGAGYASASGWSKSPTVGGLSWLAHSTFLSGLWIDSQARYDRLMTSDRPTLNRLFHDAGWRTAAIMPAITMDWNEASCYGYDDIFAARDLGYKGKPFNWVTMPDQYTLSAFDRLVRHPADAKGRPVMAEMALISSHAPWTPVPSLIDWENVKDGIAFNDQADSGDPPSVVWADQENVRQHYVGTIDYSLQTVGEYIARFGGDAVFIILGDHQPASIITGPNASRAVPVHIISREKSIVERFRAEGFEPGMRPRKDAPEQSMNTMRDRLIRVFAGPAAP